MGCPPIPVRIPAGVAAHDPAVEVEFVAIEPMRAVLKGAAAHITVEHDLLVRHGGSPRSNEQRLSVAKRRVNSS